MSRSVDHRTMQRKAWRAGLRRKEYRMRHRSDLVLCDFWYDSLGLRRNAMGKVVRGIRKGARGKVRVQLRKGEYERISARIVVGYTD